MNKTIKLVAGKPGNRHYATMQYEGELTPALAIQAAQKAYGHANGVMAWDGDTTYRITNGRAKKVREFSYCWLDISR